MSGHSKWSQIKRQKGATDKRRGTLFSKLSKLLSVAAKQGGSDPDANPRLRMLIDQARGENMPKDTIDRAIARGASGALEDQLVELRFEIYGLGGVGILAHAATDNRNRTTADLKAVVNKADAKLAAVGSVAYQFVERGLLIIAIAEQTLPAETIELTIIESGAQKYEVDEDETGLHMSILTDPQALQEVKQFLMNHGIKIMESTLIWEPSQTVLVDAATARQIEKLLAALLELEDITEVVSNYQVQSPEAG